MDKDVLKNLIKDVDSQLFDIVNNLICSICQELFHKPVSTPCGHSFCSSCIKRVLSSKNNSGCPLCKNAVKRYGLETNEVKSTLTRICKKLPDAFEEDVKELTDNLTDFKEELIRSSKISLIQNQEFSKDYNSKKKKTVIKSKLKNVNKLIDVEKDSETFIPRLKRTKNVLEYAGAKKKKVDDLISISQTEPASNPSLCESPKQDKKLEKIEKIPLGKKVSEWFKSVGDNIYINSPSYCTPGTNDKNDFDSNKRDEDKLTMNNKSGVGLKKGEEDNKPVDPYEFVPSQNNKTIKKRIQKRSTGKKSPGFKTLQKFSKESIKQNKVLVNDNKGSLEDKMKNEQPITASQKFDQLLLESKADEKTTHALYSASQSSSIQFLDVSFQSKSDKDKNEETPQVQRKLTEEENVLFKNLPEESEIKKSSKTKRSRSTGKTKRGKKKNISEITVLPSSEVCLLENSSEKFLIESKKETEPSKKLGTLLNDLLNEDMIYATRPPNAPVRLPDLGVMSNDVVPQNHTEDDITENTKLIGFCPEEVTSGETIFKEIVKNMEEELKSNECLMNDSEQVENYQFRELKLTEENPKTNSVVGEKENSSYVLNELENKIQKTQFIKFLRLGKLIPIRKRTKSTVVKLVFPIGLTSLARRRPCESRLSAAIVPKKQICQISEGVQTSQPNVSSFVQTSQVPQFSVNLQTSQEVKPSVEIQTTQKWTSSAGIQTSQRFVSQEIQTSQIESKSMKVQTLQVQSQFSPNSNTEILKTPVRKPSYQHSKMIRRKQSEELFQLSESQSPIDKDFIMDFGTEKELEDTWQNTQKHKHLVDIKNKKNKKQNERFVNECRKSADIDSDDSDLQPHKMRSSFKTLSPKPVGRLTEYETRQLVPLDVRKLNQDEEMEVINLNTQESKNSQNQTLLVLKNIESDFPKKGNGNHVRGEKSEESDSDIFVEQTPPRNTSWAVDDIRNLSRIRYDISPVQKEQTVKENENHGRQTSGETELVGDSLPKGFSESFLLSNTPQKASATSEKKTRNETQKKTSSPTVDLPNENDQNQLNAFDGKIKTTQPKASINVWKRTEFSTSVKPVPPRKLCVVASSVKNHELIKRFVSRFKIEYLTKPTKNMTHLIVGLHENDDKEVLPLCTPKLLFAMANKKWVVSELWAETCLKMDMILPEEAFETSDPAGGCGCRKARLSDEKLLKNCEIYLLGDFQMISKEDFADLIMDCGGTLVTTPEKFSFSPVKLRMIIADQDCLTLSEKQLQELYQKYSTVILSRDIIIMSIQNYQVINLCPYLLHPASEESLVKLGYPLSLVKNEGEGEEYEGEDSNPNIS